MVAVVKQMFSNKLSSNLVSQLKSPPQLPHHAMISIATIQRGINEPDNKGNLTWSHLLFQHSQLLQEPPFRSNHLSDRPHCTGSKPGFFSGGADKKEFPAGEVNKPSLHDIINLIESSPKLALFCNYGLSTRSAKFGLPEVRASSSSPALVGPSVSLASPPSPSPST